MENLKIRVNNADESKEIQNILESKGFKKGEWWSESGSIGGFIWTDSDMEYCDNRIKHFDGSPRKEITLPELRAMVNPMKEYLMPGRNYEYILTDAREALELHAEDWIEIPEGAEILTGLESDKFSQVFWKPSVGEVYQDGAFRSYDFNKSMSYEEYKLNWTKNLVLWQRATHPEELPFIDDEPKSINDQYTEIEQVRQQERNSSAWDVQVGGDHYKQFQIQPMQFALENKLDAAQQNVIKYIMRHSFKNGKQDLEKAKHYIDLMIEFYYGEINNG